MRVGYIKFSRRFFFVYSDALTPYAYAPPWTPLNPGVLFHIMVVDTFTCFTRQTAMESSVVSSLPDHAFTPTLASMGWNDQL